MKDFREVMDARVCEERSLYYKFCKRLEMQSGLSMSVQANEGAYCYPRKNLQSYTDHYEFEVGFPSEKIDDFMEYAENPDEPTDTVYGWVPWETIQKVIEDNGGLK